MSVWREVISGDVLDLISGYAFKSKDFKEFSDEDDLPVIKIKNVANGDVNFDKVVYHEVTDKLKKYILEKGDVLISMTGNHPHAMTQVVGDVSRYKLYERALLNQRVGKLVVKNNNCLDFFYYYFKDENNRNHLANQSSGSANQANISKGDILGLPMLIPEPAEQRAIASVLSSLDDKIDLLHRQNQTLEQMAETLFRQWFMEEAGDNWEFTSLENFVTCFNGVSYKSADLNPSDKAMITLKSFARDGGFRLDGFKEYTGKYKEQHIVHEGDLVVAHTDITQDAALIGNPILVIGRREYDTLLISMDLVKVVSKHDWLSNEFLYYQMKARDFKQHCLGYSNGSTVFHLSKEAVPSFEFFLPPKELIASFTNQVKPLIEKSNKNIKHIRNIEEIRGTLLPKLMSGEVKVG